MRCEFESQQHQPPSVLSKVCLAGYHPGPGDGPAITRPCLQCGCNPEGSLDEQCDEEGVCPCKPGVAGPKFVKYVLDDKKVSQSCFQGAMNARQTTGDFLDRVRNLFHKKKDRWFSGDKGGCKQCGCLEAGSLDNHATCNLVDGSCLCKQNVEGRHCDQCRQGHFKVNLPFQ